jgi:hypothetical protein
MGLGFGLSRYDMKFLGLGSALRPSASAFSRRRQLAWAGLLGCSVLATGTAARASGPVEALAGVCVQPGNPQRLLVRYDNAASKTGLLYSDDGGETFSLLCAGGITASAIRGLSTPDSHFVEELSQSQARLVLMTGAGHTLVGSTEGLFVDDGTGCAFRLVSELSGLWISGIAGSPSHPSESYVITNGSFDASAPEVFAREGLYKRKADGSFVLLAGATMAPSLDDSWSTSGLLVAGTDTGTRFYTTSLRYTASTRAFDVLVLSSDDDGEHWSESEVEVPDGAAFSLLAVDPTDPDRVVAVLARPSSQGGWDKSKDSLLVSRDGGKSFQPYAELSELTGAFFAADGTLWLSDKGLAEDAARPMGLFRGEKGLASAPVALIDDQSINCLGPSGVGDQLFLCRRIGAPDEFGRFDPTSREFTGLTSMIKVGALHSCAGQDVAADCHDQLCNPGWCGPGHYAVAPLCSAYDEPLCGNDADNWNSGDGDGDAGESSVDGGVGSDPGKDGGSTPRLDGGSEVPPRKRSKDDCSVHAPGSARSPSLTGWAFLLLGGLIGGRGLVRTRRRSNTNPWKDEPPC